MNIKSFKTYIKEDDTKEWKEVYPGVFWDGWSDEAGLSEKMMKWLSDHAGFHAGRKDSGGSFINSKKYGSDVEGNNVKEYPRDNSLKDYYLMNISKLKNHLSQSTNMYKENGDSIKVARYKLVTPENRKIVANILAKLAAHVNWDYNDEKLKQVLGIENDRELYHFDLDVK